MATQKEVIIEPINQQQQQHVVYETNRYISFASNLYDKYFESIPVKFSLRGRNVGMYRVLQNQREIRYNPHVFAKYFDDNVAMTIPHEVAHYVVDQIFGLQNVKPHGEEWRQVMAAFGCAATRTCQYDLSGIPIRRQARFPYRCSCGTHELSATRHYNIQRGDANYLCRKCKSSLISLVTAPDTKIAI